MHLSREAGIAFNRHSFNGQEFAFDASTGFHVTAAPTEKGDLLEFVSNDATQQQKINSIAREANSRASHMELGSTVWYSARCVAPECMSSGTFSIGSFMEQLGSQTGILGWRRLGGSVLIEFTHEVPKDHDPKKLLYAPKTFVDIHLAISAPCAGNFSNHLAHSVLEIASAICSFALGRVVNLPVAMFPTRAERLPELASKRYDNTILTLARKHVSLDIFTSIGNPGYLDHFQRIRAALLTFEAAKQQRHDAVACILYVVVAECLTSLQTSWRDSKLTKRFIEFFDALMPEELDQIVAHGNFEAVFDIRRGTRSASNLRRNLLDQIYDFRSGNLHAGLSPSYAGLVPNMKIGEEVRRSLFSDFAEGAILRYLNSPRSSLIGHPNFSQ